MICSVEVCNRAGRNTAFSDDPDNMFLTQLRELGWDIVADDKVKYPDGKDKPMFAPKLYNPDGNAYPDPGLMVPLDE